MVLESRPPCLFYIYDFHTVVGGIGCGPFALGKLAQYLDLRESQAGHWRQVASPHMDRVLPPLQTSPFSSFELPRVLLFTCQL